MHSLFFSSPADREVQRILLELLNQMDGFDQNVNVKVSPVHLSEKALNFPPVTAPSLFVLTRVATDGAWVLKMRTAALASLRHWYYA